MTKPHEGGTWADQQDQQEGGSANTADRFGLGPSKEVRGIAWPIDDNRFHQVL